jgi:hypothetical protein
MIRGIIPPRGQTVAVACVRPPDYECSFFDILFISKKSDYLSYLNINSNLWVYTIIINCSFIVKFYIALHGFAGMLANKLALFYYYLLDKSSNNCSFI